MAAKSATAPCAASSSAAAANAEASAAATRGKELLDLAAAGCSCKSSGPSQAGLTAAPTTVTALKAAAEETGESVSHSPLQQNKLSITNTGAAMKRREELAAVNIGSWDNI